MREALAGLTIRGRAFIAAGITAIVCAVVLGQPALNRVGVLILALPLITAAVLGRSRYRLALTRAVSPQLIVAGSPARVDLALTNEGRTPSGVLLLEDQVPYALGTRPRFVLEGIGRGWKRNVSYQVRSDVRGRFEIGPMSVRVTDPFGLVELGRAFHTTVPLIVTPRTTPLQTISLGGGWSGSGDNRPRTSATGSAEDVTVRDYRRGDDLRRVHWRSSARTGELMVRREEQPLPSRVSVLIDNRACAHRGQSIASSLETAVSSAASIAVHLQLRGFAVRLVTADGEHPSTRHLRDSDLGSGPLLEALATLPLLPATQLNPTWLRDQTAGGIVVAVLGRLDPQDVPLLRRIRHHHSSALAVALDVDRWDVPVPGRRPARPAEVSPSPPPAPSAHGSDAPVLLQQGWRAATLTPEDRLDTVWLELGLTGQTRPRTAPDPAEVAR